MARMNDEFITIPEKYFTLQELLRFDGENGPIYVAYNGIVYDVSESFRWRNGIHENLHFPGQDLTSAIGDAPHGPEVFHKMYIHPAGKLLIKKE
jgi:predicted heme/steroid binding protein